jgi:hypothetical protein
MPTVTVILGLCGSGKSYFLKRMVGVEPFEEGVIPELPQNWRRFFDALAEGKHCAIIEIRYLTEPARRKLVEEVRRVYPDTIFNWICFENDLGTANSNCRNDPKRNEEKVNGDLDHNTQWTQSYEYPKGAVVLKIFPLPSRQV